MSSLPKIAVAVSGSGRSLENLIKQSSFEVACVISNKKNCKALAIAKSHQVNTIVVSAFDSQVASQLNQQLLEEEIKLLVLAGFLVKMPVLQPLKDCKTGIFTKKPANTNNLISSFKICWLS